MGKQLQTQIHLFEDPDVNDVASYVVNSVNRGKEHMKQAKQELELAIVEHWKRGKRVDEAYDKIIDECGSQRNFADEIGISEAMLSNDLRGYRATKKLGCESEGDFLDLLNQKGLKASTYNWERIPKLLNEPDKNEGKERQPKDERRLQEVFDEVEEIRQRNEANTEIQEEAEYIEKHIQYVSAQLMKENPANLEWESEHYLNYIRGYGKDLLTGETVPDGARLEPHHVDPFTGQTGGGMANKVPDCFTIPTKPETHKLDHTADSPFTKQDYQEAILTAISRYLIIYGK